MCKYKIKAPARLHINLLAMNASSYRINGGIGFAIKGFDTVISSEPWSENCVLETSIDLDRGTLNETLCVFLNKIYFAVGATIPVKIFIESRAPKHSGFGGGTSLKLAIVESVLLVNKLSRSQKEKVELSKRGGTSGVGVNTYFKGGFIADAGVVNLGNSLISSSLRESMHFEEPTLLISSKMPSWFIGVFLAKDSVGLSGSEESDFFIKNTPISQAGVEASTYHAFMGVASSVVDNNYSLFADSIRNIQELEWKRAEWNVQTDQVFEARSLLYKAGATSVGLSSFGPALYFTGENLNTSCLEALGKLVSTSPDNFGRVIERV
ncbi:hypothetical protein BTW15_18290 [Pseudomonas syringae pv. tomato]|uniref:GHMP kinase N-terminal domain-containing protein n=1 Tax=Pseudomonas syringae pv. tomato TaxID=323 RepID=A0AB36KS66_PSEUB|nr:beta-ribofuranosylaminobenzene 5'-phosphate synthase family protein [Pseudomonas syringae group genomosp. 3]KPB84633.1 Uncharacterized protein AC505_1825 [Pseudomonas syringae pv. maculicola]MBX6508922.1 hypothetical protein [Pseudomonas syringae pv. tomato]OPE58728.1 hypothetical protein BTW15_18290 [Pseudomonas syringae pv. tomato]TES53131.1 hypothetical protein E2N91_27720 [Pseudomonas syringae pv. tomato]TES77851.1 hypothetical protein E2N89_14225 [Pseudomonas syringae pv. tomato]